jgi:hypothetical protein
MNIRNTNYERISANRPQFFAKNDRKKLRVEEKVFERKVNRKNPRQKFVKNL